MDLLVLSGSRAGAVFALPDVPAVLGRAPEAHLRIDDPWISSMHALFERRGQEVWVVDLGSRNGTFVGDERVTESPLAPGSLVRFGRTEARLEAGRSLGATDGGRRHADQQRATLRAWGATEPGAAPPHAPDPFALMVRPLALLRVALLIDPAMAPPDVLALRDGLEAAARAAMREGGRATRLAGAGILAVFGFGGAAPDDAARAMRAARAAREDVRTLVPALDVRVAVEQGLVYSGNLPTAAGPELVALGEAVERVEALLALARGGEAVVGPGVGAAADPALAGAAGESAAGIEGFRRLVLS